MLKIGILYFIFILLLTGGTAFIIFRSKIRNPFPLMLVFSILLIIPIVAGYVYLTNYDHIPEVIVPNLAGREPSEAIAILTSMGLSGRVDKQVYESSVEEGKIINHYPEAGESVKIGRTINLIVSLGNYKVVVPNLIGKNITQVDDILRALNLGLGEQKTSYDNDQDEGTVISQAPTPETIVPAGTSIEVTIIAR